MARARDSMAPLPALALSTVAERRCRCCCSRWRWASGSCRATGRPLIALALVSQVLGQGCMIYALGQLSPLVVGLALLIQPVVAAAIGWLVYGERLGAPDLVGAALVAAALVLVRSGRARLRRRGAKAHLDGPCMLRT